MAILQLLRISALPTLLSTVLASYFIGGGGNIILLIFLLLFGALLYLGGVVLNDYFDAAADAIERPERPIPSGKISIQTAFILGMSLITLGVFAGFICPFIGNGGVLGRRIAIAIVMILYCCVISYDAFLKQLSIIGPVTMGTCRILCYLFVFFTVERNVPAAHIIWSIFIGAYVMCLTMISRFESNSQKKQKLVGMLLLFLIPLDAVACLFFAGIIPALFVILLCPVAILLRRFFPMA
ncbi:MAG: UbiA family prenyltransferase [Planctomycetaceae bacterium]|jgi:4-hydroxybenzoate polyprenyltransferase|nr:UbiA family prenyltransferase [Planctomycetaceae bacterium]